MHRLWQLGADDGAPHLSRYRAQPQVRDAGEHDERVCRAQLAAFDEEVDDDFNPASGVLWHPSVSSAELDHRFVERAAGHLADAIATEF